MSYRVLVSDLARRYRGETLAPIDYTFARYLAEHPTGGAERDRDRAWWQERLDDLPTAPMLPVRTRSAEEHRTVRHHHWLEPEAKARCSPRRTNAASPRRWRWHRCSPK